ncbi:helix-turn-helix domain-containing protein [Calycomorphotria hydatis]|uniref:Helix-turn-helix domain protein n=1 Tax=Calycomorphotria hydatis TaxID=2528027 RepID=A0A517T5A9_9PLAN|nr:Helix-turn-helix domain protein [Calycomorphotria hydatis]
MSETGESYLSIKKFARLSGLSESTVRRRINDGTLPYSQPGGHGTAIRIPRNAFDLAIPHSSEMSSEDTVQAPKLRGPAPQWRNRLPK